MLWKIRGKEIHLEHKALIMGVLNVTPDSFSDGGQHAGEGKALERAMQMIQEGADIIDIGGESTRPGALKVDQNVELSRTIPVVEALRKKSDVIISIDTSKAEVARQAIAAGADVVNDVTGLRGDEEMLAVCASGEVAVVVMHMQGTPESMQESPVYTDVVEEVRSFFCSQMEKLTQQGIDPLAVCLDPGIGFGKTLEHNQYLLQNLESLRVSERPLMLGVSRKSLIGAVLKKQNPLERDWGTVALTAYGAHKGINVHRVHAVKENADALRMTEAILTHPSVSTRS
jgi:dihydropteroate synthase